MAVLADVACDAAEVEAVGAEDDAGVGVPAVGKERSQGKDRVHGVRSSSQNTSSGARAAALAPRMR